MPPRVLIEPSLNAGSTPRQISPETTQQRGSGAAPELLSEILGPPGGSGRYRPRIAVNQRLAKESGTLVFFALRLNVGEGA